MSDATHLEFDWANYYTAIATQPPRHTLVRTLTHLDRLARSHPPSSSTPQHALDLGSGSGRDTLLLLERGWHVHAIDAEAQAIAILHQRVTDRARRDSSFGQHLSTQTCRFEQIQWPPALQLVNASFSLPFCPPDHFPKVWQALRRSLQPNGWFCGQFFGDRDEWSTYANVVSLSRTALLRLFDGATIVELEEAEYDGQTATGTPKHWHIFHVIAQHTPTPEGDTETIHPDHDRDTSEPC